MIIGKIDYKNKLFFIIEEGQFNLGNFDRAIQMIDLASRTGANAIEFQLAYASDFYIATDPGHEIYKPREFSDDQLKDLISFTHKNNLHFIATCLSHNLVKKMADYGADGFNINASDINNPMIIDSVVATGLPFFVSMPLASKEEVDWIVNRINKMDPNAEFALLHGQHPMASGKEFVELEDTSIGFIRTAAQDYGRPSGFIDHTPFFWMPSVAVASGARIISKHLTASHVFNGPDHTICLDPSEMKMAIQLANDTFHSVSNTEKVRAKGEDMDIAVMRRSLVSVRKIRKGDVITAHDIVFKRPGTGIPLDELELVIGKVANKDIEGDILLTYEMFS